MLIGNVGADPELRYTPNGAPVAEFTMAVNRRYTTGDGEQKEETEWFRIVTWNKNAENVNQYLTKGQKVYVEGRFQSREYVGQDGNQRRAYEVVANMVTFLSGALERRDNENDEDVSKSQKTTTKGESIISDNSPQEEDDKDLPW
ncbi:uncharacterized protein METZ01_LOCUS398875 [marine metagenome]|uniref:Single-stranded DNA-binding protein n=1 Tax=marine metagenome TaxID=408172 RepID=A0A382VJF7_9ZZZZ